MSFFALCAVSTCFASLRSAPALVAAARPAPSPIVSQAVLRQHGPRGLWEFQYRYPQIRVPGALMGVQGIVREFNRRMKEQAEQARAQFKKEVVEYASATPVKAKSELSVRYEIVTRTPALLAIKFTQFEYFRGAAHPVESVFTRNFAMRGAFVKLGDLFAPQSHYLGKIAAAVERELTAQAKKKDFEIIEPKGYAARAENFQNFVITREGLKLFFNPAEVAASYVGVLSATVPWSAVEAELSGFGRELRSSSALQRRGAHFRRTAETQRTRRRGPRWRGWVPGQRAGKSIGD